MTKKYPYIKIKRIIDFVLAVTALILLFPLLLVLTVVGFFAMKGNPFFLQERPGKNEQIFKLIKFRTMLDTKDGNGNLLPDEKRLNRYGKFLRKTSMDELLGLLNIVKGDMSIVGPRPLSTIYLDYYNDEEKKRHTVLPGLTGLAQINGRNLINWNDRFTYDIQYVENISFLLDTKIIIKTIGKIFKNKDVSIRGTTQIKDFHVFRMEEWERSSGEKRDI